MSDTLTWQMKATRGRTSHLATTSNGKQYVVKKEDEHDFVLFFDGEEIGGGSSARAVKSVAQSHHEKLTMKEAG